MTRFILEARKKNGLPYPANSLYHICSGIMRHFRVNGRKDVDLFSNKEFDRFKSSLDAEMKRLQGEGIGAKKKQAEVITEDEEDLLWEKGLLGDHSPKHYSILSYSIMGYISQ